MVMTTTPEPLSLPILHHSLEANLPILCIMKTKVTELSTYVKFEPEQFLTETFVYIIWKTSDCNFGILSGIEMQISIIYQVILNPDWKYTVSCLMIGIYFLKTLV